MTARPRHAVVTGSGAVTPYGIGTTVFRSGLLAGRPTAATVQAFDVSDLPVRFACEAPDFEPSAYMSARIVRRTDRFSQFAVVAAQEALGCAGLIHESGDGRAPALVPGADPSRIAVVIASGNGGKQLEARAHDVLRTQGPTSLTPYLPLTRPTDAAAAAVAHRFGFAGPCLAVASACASGTDALGVGLDLIRAGRADVVVAGGAEAGIDRLTLAAFARAGALSLRNHDPATASRPFDADRDGFVCGEGAGILILERAEHAAARAAPAQAHLAGSAATTDPTNPLRPDPEGGPAATALLAALRDAGLTPTDVQHIDAHGTGTILNDRAEANALRTVMDGHLDTVPVTAIKSAIGHLMGAAGAVAAVAAVGTINDGLIPPTQNLHRRDPACDIDLVTERPRRHAPRVVISESFGFGGHNSVVVLTAP